MTVEVIIPALNEAAAIGSVVEETLLVSADRVVVVDNGSSDGTGDLAQAAGAHVVREPRLGYGSACLAGISALSSDAEIVVFMDADGSDDPRLMPQLVEPILQNRADLVVGSRSMGLAERGSLSPQQRVGNTIAAHWLSARFGLDATDLGPFRAIERGALQRLNMRDLTYGWTVEMQLKAAVMGLRYAEVAVPYRVRIGQSKISGTLRGTLGASYKILQLLWRHDRELRSGSGRPARARPKAKVRG